MGKLKTLIVGFIALLALSPTVFAASGDLALQSSDVTFSQSYYLEGSPIRIWASVHNNSSYDLLGSVRFSTQDGTIDSDQPISALSGSTDDVFVDWLPSHYGYYSITVTVYPWDATNDDPNNNTVQRTIYVEMDTDHDGVANSQDDDWDNDGTLNGQDLYPYDVNESADTDGDGIGDNTDEDDDNDGVLDKDDAFLKDPMYSSDQDSDGTPDESDEDLDGDGLTNPEEEDLGTSPNTTDSDNDRVSDGNDPFPTDPTEWADYDHDRIGDNTDEDIDGDGTTNTEDPAPSNKSPEAALNQNIYFASIGETVTFDASASADEDGEITSYEWEFTTTDGKVETATGQVVQKTFSESGLQNVLLTVGDNSGQTSKLNFDLRVLDYKFLLFALLFALILISLAFYIIYRYNSRASEHKQIEHRKHKNKIKEETHEK